MSLVTKRSRPLPGVLLLLVALALVACLPPTAHAQVALTLFVSGTGDPSPVPSCFSVIGQLAMLETPGLPATATDVVSGVGATLTAQTFGSLSCPSLRAAIRHANTHSGSIIVLQGGSTYTLGIRGPDEDNALTGDLDIRSNVKITTNATSLGTVATVRGSIFLWNDRIFDIRSGVVQFENLSIQGGQVGGFGDGGGIRNSGTLTLTNCTVTGNSANGGGGITNGGIPGILTLINSTVVGNSARGPGGGIGNFGGTLTLISSTIRQNNAFDGGGLSTSGNNTLTNSTISDNRASRFGGGIQNNGTLELTGTTLSSNRVDGAGDTSAGIFNQEIVKITGSTISSNFGTGIVNDVFANELKLTNSTVSSNTGDGILNDSPFSVVLNNATIALNTLHGVRTTNGFVSISNTILADTCLGTLVSSDHNLFQFPTPTCRIMGLTTHDRFGLNPLLGDLRFNGGQTLTHAPAPGSPAIDNGNPAQVGSFPPNCPSTDQRGTTRPLDGDRVDPDGSGPIPPAVCDIGAVEVRPPLIVSSICCVIVATTLGVLDLTPTEATVRVGERFTYAFEWTVPQEGWRSLDTLELRLVDGARVILWVRFAETADPPGSLGTFSLVNEKTGREGPSFAPGRKNRLETNAATVYLEGSAAHGPPGSTVGLTLELSVKHQAAGRTYTVEVLATDDDGAGTGFVEAGTLTVLPAKL